MAIADNTQKFNQLITLISNLPDKDSISSEATLESGRSVAPTETENRYIPNTGYDGFSDFTVQAIPSTYVGSGIARQSANTITPGTSDQSIPANTYLTGSQTIKGDANLLAGNIKKGATIFNVAGTYEGSSNGIAVSRTEADFSTNNNGTATINCGFKPDLVYVYFIDDTSAYVSAAFYEAKKYTSVKSMCWFEGDNGRYIEEARFSQTNTGFRLTLYYYTQYTDDGTYVDIDNRQADSNIDLHYVAIKYT